MRPYLGLAALVVGLAGCGALDQDSGFTNPECRTAMYADPAVKDALAIVAISGHIARGEERPAFEAAKQRAYNSCLRDKGLLRGGGYLVAAFNDR